MCTCSLGGIVSIYEKFLFTTFSIFDVYTCK